MRCVEESVADCCLLPELRKVLIVGTTGCEAVEVGSVLSFQLGSRVVALLSSVPC